MVCKTLYKENFSSLPVCCAYTMPMILFMYFSVVLIQLRRILCLYVLYRESDVC